MRFISWNVNGIRSVYRKDFWNKIKHLDPSIISVQETRADPTVITQKQFQQTGFSLPYFSAIKKGYSGVATYCKDSDIIIHENIEGTGVDEFDIEGRAITHLISIKDSGKKIAYLNIYCPQGTRGPERVEYKIRFFNRIYQMCESYKKQGYSIILSGDFNTTVGDLDLTRYKENRTKTGCLHEERAALNRFLYNGYIDTFRHFYPDRGGVYSYWYVINNARSRNVGWRLDYFVVSDDLIDKVQDAFIWMDVMGSDHCPVGIDITL